ncbi:hypothetical protein OA855_01840 [Pelagibacteraceae bacterium]|nr:hypothetical protein [Pelagibacteraceae bacterium]
MYFILIFIYVLLIKRHKKKLFLSKNNKYKKILSLGASKYRGDLKSINEFENFDLYSIDHSWQSLIRRYFCTSNKVRNYLNPKNRSIFYFESLKFEKFMKIFFKKLNNIYNFDLIMVVNYRYIDDYFWLKAAKENKIPIVMLYREGLLASSRVADEVCNRHKIFKNFPVDYLITQNNISKEKFVESKFIENDKIFISGALRMNNFFQKIQKRKIVKNTNKINILYFAIPPNLTLFGGKDYRELTPKKYEYVFSNWEPKKLFFDEINNLIIDLAKDKYLNVTIRPKLEDLNKNIHKNILEKIKKNQNSNIKIDAYSDTHELIFNSDIIIGIQSSSLLEAMIANKIVILPLFKNFRQSKHFNDMFFKDNLNLFSVHENSSSVIKFINNFKINNNVYDMKNYDQKIQLWNKYFFTNKPITEKLYENNFKKILNI